MSKNAEKPLSGNLGSFADAGLSGVAEAHSRQSGSLPAQQGGRQVTCRLCGRGFDPLQMRGEYLNRRCPHCGGRLTEDDYDADAAEWCKNRKRATLLREKIREEMRVQQQRIMNPKWWQRLLKRRWIRKLKQAGLRLSRCDQMQREATQRLKQIASDRYYVSEWFQCTHLPLMLRDDEGRVEYRMGAGYMSGGLFTLKPEKGMLSAGYIGEYIVFEQMRKRVITPGSPLHGARLLPNLFLPHDGSEEEMQKGLWRQVDCVLATREAAFVLEVKRWNARISAKAPFAQVYVKRSEGKGASAPADSVLAQVESAANAFRNISPYDDERIFRVVVFVRPREFETDAKDFCGRLLISDAYEGSAAFVQAIERKVLEMEAGIDAETLEAWANDVLIGFGDLRGEYRRAARGNRRDNAGNSNGGHSRKGTRAYRARKHHAQKRSQGRKRGEGAKDRAKAAYLDEWDWWFEENAQHTTGN